MEGDLLPGGKIHAKGYSGMAFTPIIFLPDLEGKAIMDKLQNLEDAMIGEIEAVQTKYRKKADEIAPFLGER